MKKSSLFLITAALVLLAGCASERIYVGSSAGIFRADFTSHGLPVFREWKMEKMVADSNISYMTVKERTLYAARRVAKGAFAVDVFTIRRNGQLKKIDAFIIPGNHGYCHISLSNDGKYLFGSSYSGGFMDMLSLVPGGGIIRLKQRCFFSGNSVHKRQKKSHPHFAAQTPDGSTVLVADLGCDRIHTFKYETGKELVRTAGAALPPGSGPRHLSFSADGKFVFAVNELNNSVTSFKWEKGALKMISNVSSLPEKWEGNSYAGAVKTAPDGKVYVTNRGHNSISVFTVSVDGKLTLENTFSSQGDFPCDLLFAGKKMFLANMKSNQFLVFEKGGQWQKEAGFSLHRPQCVVTPSKH